MIRDVQNHRNAGRRKKDLRAAAIRRTLIDISSAVSTTFDLDELFRVVHCKLARVINVTNFAIGIVDRRTGILSFPFFRDEWDVGYDSGYRFADGDSLDDEVLRVRRPLLLQTADLVRRAADRRVAKMPLIWLGVPLMTGNEILGVMSVKSYTNPDQFDRDDLEILTSISQQLAVAIERKVAVDSLRLSEERLRGFVEGTDDLVVQLDKEGIITYCNHTAERIFGEPADACIGWAIIDFVHKDDAEAFLDAILQILSRRRTSIVVENRFVNRRSGEAIPLHWTIRRQYDTCGQSVVVNGIAHDLTNRNRAEEERLKVLKLESIGVLSGGIAHDFNNMLSVVIGNLDLLQMKGNLREREREFIHAARQASLRAKELTLQLISFSLGDAPRLVPGNLGDVIAICVDRVRAKVATQIELDIAPDLQLLCFDAFQVDHVIDKLLDNAVEAVAAGGSVRVRLYNHHPDVDIGLQTEDEPPLRGRLVVIEISDTGVGIPDAHRLRVFDPYFSTKSRGNQKGIGLGLSVAYAIVRRHQGEIRIWSKPGSGTTVRVYLPAEVDPDRMN
ncbi:PAS domain S-box protein [Desulfoprunum benzoelyticum]|uniref:histidine kinase n=1 Tax=Desulfoprunum benzoelyticum TaxID=1506996 RepID=A0A840UU78_9BACT|nr:ATP-binding protein [Desulfoprunum benzoelyticum]MBB5349245.1 PAS domain S-box-containing protein [Desulfoprunum benzoelyticum]MBM9530824.1 PAS domain S-box protein [Desulfoprunum benzoelyticum]